MILLLLNENGPNLVQSSWSLCLKSGGPDIYTAAASTVFGLKVHHGYTILN